MHNLGRRRLGWSLSVVFAVVTVLPLGGLHLAAQDAPGQASAGLQASSTDGVLTVSGDVPTPLTLDQADLAKLPRVEVQTKDRAGHDAAYAGPTLATLMRAAGLKFDPATMPAKGAMASYIVIGARDGYEVVFALGEIDPTVSNQTIILADTKDGQPLSPAEGPWRVIVPGDKRPARSVRQVNAVTVHGG